MNKLYIVMYHYTRDLVHSRYEKIRGLDIRFFDEQIKFLKSNFEIVTMEKVIENVLSKKEMTCDSVLLTFDDGYIDNFTYAMPILEKYGVQGSFFIPGKTFKEHKLLDVNKIHYILASANITSLVKDVKERMDYYRGKSYIYDDTKELYEKYAVANRFDDKDTIFVKRILQTVLPEELRNIISSELFEKYVGVSEEKLAYELYMTYDQVKIMKKNGMFIGLHGYDHYWLANLTEEQMHNDIDEALEALDEFIDRKAWVMNYPYGNNSDNVIDYIKTKGCVMGLTTEVRIVNLKENDRYRYPRLDCNDFPPKSENYKNY